MSSDFETRFKEAERYMKSVDQCTHPFVKAHFFQVTELLFKISEIQNQRFPVLEFRCEKRAILAWQDDQDNWGAGRWVDLIHNPIAYENPADQYSVVGMYDSDYELPPIPLSYFKNAKAFLSLDALAVQFSSDSWLA